MKKLLILFFILFAFKFGYSQIVFNRIIEDTVAHITNSILANETGYIMLTGTSNECFVRCFSLIKLDSYGNRQVKKVYGEVVNEFWEGHSSNLKKSEDYYYFSGSFNNIVQSTKGIHLSVFNEALDLQNQKILCNDEIWKKSYTTLQSSAKDFYCVGSLYDSNLDDAFLLVVKTDSIGNFIWQRTYGSRNEFGKRVIETTDNNLLIGGATFSFPTTVTDEDWYLIKLDTAGNVIWQNGFGRPGFLNYDGPVQGLIETRDSNYVACGGYPALRSDTDTYWDGCLRKVSKDGVLMWERFYRSYFTLTNPVTDWYENIVTSVIYKNDDLFVIGNWRSGIGRSRSYLQKINENGDICWNREYYAIDYTTNDQYLVSFQPTADSGFILAGYGNSYNTHGYNPPQQAWLVKTDSLGIDGLCYTEPPALNVDIVLPATVNCSDTITVYAYIAGKSAPYTIETSVGQVIDSIYYPPLFVPIEIGLSQAEIEYGGNIIYTQQITEATLSNHEWGQCIAKPVEFYTPHTSGSQQINITVTDAYGESKTITKEVWVNDNCGSWIAGEVVNLVSLYPNPARDNLYLYIGDFDSAQSPSSIQVAESRLLSRTSNRPETAEIYNSVGQLVKTLQLSNDLTVINVKDFASGVYVLKINSESKTYSLSFEKE